MFVIIKNKTKQNKKTLFLFSKILFPNFKVFVCTEAQTLNLKLQRGTDEPSIIISVLRPKDETENKYDTRRIFSTALIQPIEG